MDGWQPSETPTGVGESQIFIGVTTMTRKYKTVRTETFVVGTAADLGCDPDGGKWVHICLVHQAITNFRTKRDALKCVTIRAMKGCEQCVTEIDAGVNCNSCGRINGARPEFGGMCERCIST